MLLYETHLVIMSKAEANSVLGANGRLECFNRVIHTCVSLKGFLGRNFVQNSIFSRLLISGEQTVRILDVLLKSMS